MFIIINFMYTFKLEQCCFLVSSPYYILVSIRFRCSTKLSFIISSDVIRGRNKYAVIKCKSVTCNALERLTRKES